jgi:bifunctional DNase/RNase
VFFANVLCDNGGERTTLDARTSDAIALALRFKCPIYTTDEIVEKAGIVLDFEKGTEIETQDAAEEKETEEPPVKIKKGSPRKDLSKNSMEELKTMLAEAVSKEDYEKASEIRDEINRRSK